MCLVCIFSEHIMQKRNCNNNKEQYVCILKFTQNISKLKLLDLETQTKRTTYYLDYYNFSRIYESEN